MRILVATLLTLLALVAPACGGPQQLEPVPWRDAGVYVLPGPNDGGVVVKLDGGTTVSCLPSPCQEDAGGCHTGYQECLPDGTHGACQLAEGCPTQTGGCDGGVDLFFVMDDSGATDAQRVSDYITAQQAVETFVFENPGSNYRYAGVDVPGCSNPWARTSPGFSSVTNRTDFMGFISIQCMSTGSGDVQAALGQQLADGGIPWDSVNRYVFVFTTSARVFDEVDAGGVTVVTFGLGELTLDGIFQYLTDAVRMGCQ